MYNNNNNNMLADVSKQKPMISLQHNTYAQLNGWIEVFFLVLLEKCLK